MRKRPVHLIVLLILISLVVVAGLRPAPARAQYAQVRILVQLSSHAEQDDFQMLLIPAFQQYNVQPTLVSAVDLEQTLREQVSSGTPPDIVLMSQPGLLREYAQSGALVDLGAALGDPASGYPATLTDALTVDGRVYGRYLRLVVKALAWYNVPAMEQISAENGVSPIPAGWSDLLTLSEILSGTGTVSWALGLQDPEIGTDVIETILLQRYGPEVLDGLANGSIPWTDERVRDAWLSFGELANRARITDPESAALALFSDPPGAYLSAAPSTALRWITASDGRLRPGDSVAFFPFPATEGGSSGVVFGGEFIVLFNADPAVLQLAQYLASPDAAAAWVAAGSAVSPYSGADYPDAVMQQAAELVEQGDAALDLSARLDSPVRAAFYAGIEQFTGKGGDVEGILAEIQAAAGK